MKVNITKRVKVRGIVRYMPAVLLPDGRIKPDWVVNPDGIEEYRPEATSYYLDWHEDGRRHRVTVGPDPLLANRRRLQKQNKMLMRDLHLPSIDETIEVCLDELRIVMQSHLRSHLSRELIEETK